MHRSLLAMTHHMLRSYLLAVAFLHATKTRMRVPETVSPPCHAGQARSDLAMPHQTSPQKAEHVDACVPAERRTWSADSGRAPGSCPRASMPLVAPAPGAARPPLPASAGTEMTLLEPVKHIHKRCRRVPCDAGAQPAVTTEPGTCCKL